MTGGLALVTLRQWQHHRLRLGLTVLGIALGVAVFFAVRSTNAVLVRSLTTTIEKLAGKSTLQIVAGESGFSKELLVGIREIPGVLVAEPVTETLATTTLGNERILILGLDTGSELTLYSDTVDQGNFAVKNPIAFANRDDSVAITQKFARRYGLQDGDALSVDTQNGPFLLTVRGIFSQAGVGEIYNGNIAVMDILAARKLFGKGDRIDRIDVANGPDIGIDDLQKRIEATLPAGVKVVRPNLRGRSLENAVSSMHYGLTIMSFLALTIGIFIIYNSFSISVLQRRKEIGVLRALGVERRHIRRMFLAESMVMGAAGAAVGIGAGYWLAALSMRFVGDAMASFYGVAGSVQELSFDPVFAAQALIAGVAASLVAAWMPARAASELDPALALHNIESRAAAPALNRARSGAGIVLLVGGVLLTRFGSPEVGQNIQLFYSFFMMIGMILLVPLAIAIGAKLIRPVWERSFGIEGVIAVESMAQAPRRTAATVIALMIGLSFVFSHGSFVQSQKAALNRTLDKAVSADMLVAASNEIHSRTYHFEEATFQRIAEVPEVALADPVRVTSVEYGGEEISVLAHDMRSYFAVSPDLLGTGDASAALRSTSEGKGILVSNNFAVRWKKHIGDAVTLETPTGPLELTIAGTLDYFRSEKGTVFFDRSLYKKYWDDDFVDYIFVDVQPGADLEAAKSSIRSALGEKQRAFIYTHAEYKRWVSVIIDQFFALMYVQMFIAACVAIIGLVNTMLISVTERRRELAIFRAVGGLRGQVVKVVLLEAVAISLIGLVTGLIAGLLNSYFLVTAAAKIIAGFTMPLVFPIWVVLAAVPIVIFLAIISAALPAWSVARQNVIDGIGYE